MQTSRLSDNGPGELTKIHKVKIIRYPIVYESIQSVERLLLESYKIRYRIREYETFLWVTERLICLLTLPKKSNLFGLL